MSLKEQVEEILNNADNDIIREFFHSEISDNTKWDSDEVTDFRKQLSDVGIKFEHVDNYGGEEQGRSYRDWETDRKSTRLNSSHITRSRMPSSA